MSYCKSFFEKAASKHKEREQHKGHTHQAGDTPADDADVKMTDDEAEPSGMATSPVDDDATASLKRKRNENSLDVPEGDNGDNSPSKRQKSTPPPPPPPPPPPMDSTAEDDINREDDDVDVSFPPPPPPPKESPSGSGDDNVKMEIDEMQQPSHIEGRV